MTIGELAFRVFVKSEETLPLKVEFDDDVYTRVFENNMYDYLDQCGDSLFYEIASSKTFYLKVKIIEEDKKIEKLSQMEITSFNDTNEMCLISELISKINEIINVINKTKGE